MPSPPKSEPRPRVLHLTRDHPPLAKGGLSWAVYHWIQATRARLEHHVLSFDSFRPTRAGRSAPPAAGVASRPVSTVPPHTAVHPATHPPSTFTSAPTDSPCTTTATPPPHDACPVRRVHGPADLDALPPLDPPPDLILIHDAMLWQALPPMLRHAGVPRALVLHVLHERLRRLRHLDAPTMSERAQRALMGEVDALILPSPWAANAIQDDHPELRLPLHVLPPALPAPTAPLPHQDRPPGALLHAGRFDPLKGSADVLHAWPRIAAQRGDATLTMAGGYADRPASARRWRRRWEAETPEHLIARTAWEPWLTRDQTFLLLSTKSILLAPSHAETFGLGIAEALLCGCAVVSAATGAHGEWLARADAALLIPPGDPAALADATLTLINDPALRLAMIRRGQAWLRAHHASEVVAPILTSIVEVMRR